MSLAAGDQRILAEIDDGLSRADPALAARLAIFSRLAAGEEMPAWERIEAAPWPGRTRRRGFGHGRRCGRSHGRGRPGRPPARRTTAPGTLGGLRGWSLACLLVWITVTAGMIAGATSLMGGGPQRCASSRAACVSCSVLSGRGSCG